MRDTPNVTFLLVINAFMIAFLVMLLDGCVATPSRFQDRNGDFVSHIASSTPTPDQPRG